MSTVTVLDALRDFLNEEVAPTIKLQKPSDDDAGKYELVHPIAHTGWIPPNGFLPEEIESPVPCWIVGMDDGYHDTIEGGLNIRIGVVVYSPGSHKPDETGEIKFTPDYEGYRDLLNLIDRSILEIERTQIIKKVTTVQDTIKFGMYQESAYPYWYGWITLTAKKVPGMYVPGIVEQLL